MPNDAIYCRLSTDSFQVDKIISASVARPMDVFVRFLSASKSNELIVLINELSQHAQKSGSSN